MSNQLHEKTLAANSAWWAAHPKFKTPSFNAASLARSVVHWHHNVESSLRHAAQDVDSDRYFLRSYVIAATEAWLAESQAELDACTNWSRKRDLEAAVRNFQIALDNFEWNDKNKKDAKTQLEVERLTKELARAEDRNSQAREIVTAWFNTPWESNALGSYTDQASAARAMSAIRDALTSKNGAIDAAPTPLAEIVNAAAARFDERPIHRASVEAQRELAPLMNIVLVTVNGRQREFLENDEITYERLYDWFGDETNPLTVTVRHGRGCLLPPGELCAGDSVRACHGLVINARHTGNS